MGASEDFFYEVYQEISEKGIIDDFYKQLEKMRFQDHHKHKTVKESWDYAHKKISKLHYDEITKIKNNETHKTF